MKGGKMVNYIEGCLTLTKKLQKLDYIINFFKN